MITVRNPDSRLAKINARIKAGAINYSYPNNLDLRPGSELHERIKSKILDRARDSYDIMKRRHDSWNKIDETLTAYITLDEDEKVVKNKDTRKPVSIVVPYSYATLETLLTYLVNAFLEMPIFRYEGITSEDTIGAIMLEKVIEQQCKQFKTGLALHTMFRDSLAYGFGVTVPIWAEKWGWKSFIEDNRRARVRARLFEGTRLDNVDPYLYLPDPNVPIQEVQRGEFVGWVDRTNFISLMELESVQENVFNVQYLRELDGRTTLFSQDNSGRETRFIGKSRGDVRNSTLPVDVIYMYVNLIPNDYEWRLGKEKYPEKWLFGLAADEVVVMAQPMGLDHDMFPIGLSAPDYDGYSLTPISRLETVYGLQGILDFMINSHVANVRKSINDMFVVDPFLVNMKDFEDPRPGKLIRLRRSGWNKNALDKAVMQLPVTDITRSHMQDATFVVDLIQRTSGAVDSLMGFMRASGERRSATETRDTRLGALSRLAKAAKIASLMAMQDLGYMHASHTQQLMDQEVYIKYMGRGQDELQQEFDSIGGRVAPLDINVNYDLSISDGSVESGEFVDTWVELMRILASQPAVGASFDLVRIFKHVARIAGAKNINDFVAKGGGIKANVMQDAEVMAEVQKGNMMPVGSNGG